MATVISCAGCQHCKLRPEPELFSSADLQSTGGLKASLEWEQQRDQRRLLEQQRVETSEVLPYEPHFYPWCKAASPYDAALLEEVDRVLASANAPSADEVKKIRDMAKQSREDAKDLLARASAGDYEAATQLIQGQRATMNPVTGEIQQTYVLCRRVIKRAQCPLFEPRGG